MTVLRPGMHDRPDVWPTLPPKEPDETAREMAKVDSGIWRTCWEFMLTHDLSPHEGAAFWTGASLVYEAIQNEGRS